MSLQDLFKKQNKNSSVVSADNATSSAEYVESVATIKRREELNDQFVPRLDYATASNFAKFGSAELYYEFAFSRIYNEYPYDGTDQEKLEFRLSSSYLDDYIFENHYPRTNGHVIFSYANNTTTAIHDGYGRPRADLTQDPQHLQTSRFTKPSVAQIITMLRMILVQVWNLILIRVLLLNSGLKKKLLMLTKQRKRLFLTSGTINYPHQQIMGD